ncbi:MAG: ABC transporter substrate-binding protein [Rhodospirillales bacterium]|jgi:phospholipid transport system substrate-binding protein|nr:ABC transporter substrate-binding protein [Rhodospirillales bacterium]
MRIFFRALLIALVFSASAGAAKASPADMIGTYHNHLLAALAQPSSTSAQTRFDNLSSTMDASFDFESMIKTAAGKYWREATPQAQKSLLAAFRRVSIATYANRFADLTSGQFRTDRTRDGPRGLKLVDTTLVSGKDNVVLTYVTREINNSWKIIDVLLSGGISELAVRASEYASTLKNGGVPALTDVLNAQAKGLLAH